MGKVRVKDKEMFLDGKNPTVPKKFANAKWIYQQIQSKLEHRISNEEQKTPFDDNGEGDLPPVIDGRPEIVEIDHPIEIDIEFNPTITSTPIRQRTYTSPRCLMKDCNRSKLKSNNDLSKHALKVDDRGNSFNNPSSQKKLESVSKPAVTTLVKKDKRRPLQESPHLSRSALIHSTSPKTHKKQRPVAVTTLVKKDKRRPLQEIPHLSRSALIHPTSPKTHKKQRPLKIKQNYGNSGKGLSDNSNEKKELESIFDITDIEISNARMKKGEKSFWNKRDDSLVIVEEDDDWDEFFLKPKVEKSSKNKSRKSQKGAESSSGKRSENISIKKVKKLVLYLNNY